MSNRRDYQIEVLGYEPRELLFMAADYFGSEETALDGAHDEATQAANKLDCDFDLMSVWTDRNDGRGARPAGYQLEWAVPAVEEYTGPYPRLRGDEG